MSVAASDRLFTPAFIALTLFVTGPLGSDAAALGLVAGAYGVTTLLLGPTPVGYRLECQRTNVGKRFMQIVPRFFEAHGLSVRATCTSLESQFPAEWLIDQLRIA